MKQKFIQYAKICCLSVVFFSPQVWPRHAHAAWQELERGLQYDELILGATQVSLHLLKIDLKHYQPQLIQAAAKQRHFLPDLIGNSPAKAAINASFFDEFGRPLGLLIQNNKQVQNVRRNSWGIFALRNQQAEIKLANEFNADGVTLALQSGPRLVINGEIPRFKDQSPARRSGLCIPQEPNTLILAVASPQPLTLEAFAKSLQPLCPNALNLDGGSSTQFLLQTQRKTLNLPGNAPVPNALVVIKRAS